MRRLAARHGARKKRKPISPDDDVSAPCVRERRDVPENLELLALCGGLPIHGRLEVNHSGLGRGPDHGLEARIFHGFFDRRCRAPGCAAADRTPFIPARSPVIQIKRCNPQPSRDIPRSASAPGIRSSSRAEGCSFAGKHERPVRARRPGRAVAGHGAFVNRHSTIVRPSRPLTPARCLLQAGSEGLHVSSAPYWRLA